MTGVVEFFLVVAVVLVLFRSSGSCRFTRHLVSAVKLKCRTMVDILGRLQEAFGPSISDSPTIFASGVSTAKADAVHASKLAGLRPQILDTNSVLHRPLPCSNAAAAALQLYGPTSRSERQREAMRANEREVREADLYRVKRFPIVDFPPPGKRNFQDICVKCDPSVQSASIDHAFANMGIRNALLVDTRGSHHSFFTRAFCYLARVGQLKKYEYERIYSSVLTDKKVIKAIEEAANMEAEDRKACCGESPDEDTYKKILEKHRKRAVKILGDMASKLSDFMLRVKGWLLYKVLPSFLSSVIVHCGQVEVLKQASQRGIPMIILPLHRSHLDYILLSFILLDNEIRCPLVAAGDNLSIPFFGAWLRGLGAFFIRRKMHPAQGRRDVIYRTVLHSYMIESLRAGHNMEFFIEGGRTRTGKPCLPKGGLLSVIIEAYLDGVIEDALLVPCSLNYERLVDGNFVREQLGQPKIPESFFSAVRAIWSVITSHYGMIRMDFGAPYSVKELMNAYHLRTGKVLNASAVNELHRTISSNYGMKQAPSSTSLYGTDIVAEERRHAVESIARHVIYDCARVTAYVSTNVVAFLLLNEFRRGVPIVKLADAVERLKERLHARGRDVGFTGDSLDVVNHAVNLLGPGLVVKERNSSKEMMVYPVTMLPNVIELAYYSHCLLPVYALESALLRALGSLMAEKKDEASDSPNCYKVTREDLIERTSEFCDILQYEAVWNRPCYRLEHLIEDHIDRLVGEGIFIPVLKDEPEEEENPEEKAFARRVATYFDESDDSQEDFTPTHVPDPTEYEVCLESNNENVQWLTNVVWQVWGPILDMYIATVQALTRCLVNDELLDSEMIKQSLAEMKFHLEAKIASCGESMSTDTVRAAFRLFEKWGILDHYSENGIRLLYLTDQYNSVKAMKLIYERLDRFRNQIPVGCNSLCPSEPNTPSQVPLYPDGTSSSG
ncbi:glycerol-3-phosphate acyltransferase 1, mitochondrial isoform X2 [Ischnura elegans]|uniref:glycerol-3-phosphate acyltransferase 1, mitochondrial isoform X2 n=1 Tax=Ischnura elegans TaxID=197161 RepID=UPI001ED8758E|nr:glycerol-3-phosphate acyltransferase 1, mitochondrial isoform X2 [Ischnura elegans]